MKLSLPSVLDGLLDDSGTSVASLEKRRVQPSVPSHAFVRGLLCAGKLSQIRHDLGL